MTDTRRELLQTLETLSRLYPDMRFGQLVVNLANWAARTPDAVWDVEDQQLLEAAKGHLNKRPPSPVEEKTAASEDDPQYRLAELAVPTGIPDLAENVDHYLYGHPKGSDAGQ